MKKAAIIFIKNFLSIISISKKNGIGNQKHEDFL